MTTTIIISVIVTMLFVGCGEDTTQSVAPSTSEQSISDTAVSAVQNAKGLMESQNKAMHEREKQALELTLKASNCASDGVDCKQYNPKL